MTLMQYEENAGKNATDVSYTFAECIAPDKVKIQM